MKNLFFIISIITFFGIMISGCQKSPTPATTEPYSMNELALDNEILSTMSDYTDRASWEAAMCGYVSTEDFESDPASYTPLTLPYITYHGLLLEGTLDGVQLLPTASTLPTQILHFRDFSPNGVGTGLTFTLPDGPVQGFGFDWDTANEPWKLIVNSTEIIFPAGSAGFFGIVSLSPITSFLLTSSSHTQGGISVDNISYAPFCIEVALDIKPQSCPNPINTKSKGVLPAAVLGTSDFDVTQIDPASIKLEGVSPIRWNYEDVATPFEPFTGKENAYDCTTEGADGNMDLTLKFDTQEIIAALGDVTDGESRVLSLTGNLLPEFGGHSLTGADIVLIKKKGK